MGVIKAIDLANGIIDRHGKELSVTNMKVNKLVYFAYAFFLRGSGPLFDDDIEAWQYGPVVPAVYHSFKHCSSSVIAEPTSRVYPDTAAHVADAVCRIYGHLTAWDLMELSHDSRGAWAHVMADPNRSQLITDDDILASIDGTPAGFPRGKTFAGVAKAGVEHWSRLLEMLRDS